MASARMVLELSRAFALSRRGLIVVLKVYLDESGTDEGDQSHVVSVSAIAGKPKAWADFTKHWNLRKNPINIFHSYSCAQLKGEFEGWSKDERDDYLGKLLPVLAQSDLWGAAYGFNKRDLRASGASALTSLVSDIESAYGTCLHVTVRKILHDIDDRGIKCPVVFIHEDNQYKAEASNVIDHVRSLRPDGAPAIGFRWGQRMITYLCKRRTCSPTKPINTCETVQRSEGNRSSQSIP